MGTHAKALKPTHYREDPVFPTLEDGIDGFDVLDDEFLDEDESASSAVRARPRHAPVPQSTAKTASEPARTAPAGSVPAKAARRAVPVQSQATAAMAVSLSKPPSSKPRKALEPSPEHAPATIEATQDGNSMSQRLFARPGTMPVVLTPSLPTLPHEVAAKKKEPSETALAFLQWLQQGLASREIKYNETGAPVHFVEEGMALVSPVIFKLYARQTGPEEDADATGMQVQREVIKAGWHRMGAASGSGKVNILRYQVIGRGNAIVARLSVIVLIEPDRFVLPVPPANPVLKLENLQNL